MNRRTLTVELGCEELPSSCLKQLGEDFLRLVTEKLAAQSLEHGEARFFATPRRLAVQIDDLIEAAPEQQREALGPPLDKARDDAGNWTRAAEGFARRNGVTPDELQVIDTPKGARVGLTQMLPGARTSEVLADLVRDTISELPMPKRMRWGASRLEFARPIHWLVLLFGDDHDFADVHGLVPGNRSRGHRFHAPDEVIIAHAADYEAVLATAWVVADFGKRREQIRTQVEACAQAEGARALVDEDLLDEVTSLVEWPVALLGSFDDEFLEVPPEALVSSMQSHQKYFPVVDEAGTLLPRFITVSNIESRNPQAVIAGNEKVIRPRLADAAFFYRQDLQTGLASRVDQLRSVVFQERLGSIGDKSDRVARLADIIAGEIGANREHARRAGLLCKADLVSELVLEFGDLQGIAGGYYARHDGEEPAVADAVTQHYWPLQAGGRLPEGDVAVAVALADRLDTLVGIFGIGETPSGSRDPFGLRRASIGVLRLLIENDLRLDAKQVLTYAVEGYPEEVLAANTVEDALAYLLDRMPALFEARGLPVELYRAVRATGCTEPVDFVRRLDAVHAFADRPEAEALAAANKRVSNILSKSGTTSDNTEVNTHLLVEAPEKLLARSLKEIAGDNRLALEQGDYGTALTRLATLRGPVDDFFDNVMVNAEDPDQRANRLALLAELRRQFIAVADISQLAA